MAKDKFHDTVVNALKKDGWQIIKEQVFLYAEFRVLMIDLLISKNQEQRLIEVKSFIGAPVEDLATAIGKYLIYHAILEETNNNFELYLAIPLSAYEGIIGESFAQAIRTRLDIKLLVYDVNAEEIIQWID